MLQSDGQFIGKSPTDLELQQDKQLEKKGKFWLDSAIHIASPNYNQRPLNTVINCIVIHGISLPEGCFGSDDINALFTNSLNLEKDPSYAGLKDLKVSSHFLIRRDGELVQYVALEHRAWHAGKSLFQGQENCNNFSIGIELEGTDHIAYESVQYQQLSQLLAKLKKYYPKITNDRIIGHSDVAPIRKTDPGPVFDWDLTYKQLAEIERNI